MDVFQVFIPPTSTLSHFSKGYFTTKTHLEATPSCNQPLCFCLVFCLFGSPASPNHPSAHLLTNHCQLTLKAGKGAAAAATAVEGGRGGDLGFHYCLRIKSVLANTHGSDAFKGHLRKMTSWWETVRTGKVEAGREGVAEKPLMNTFHRP